MDWDAFFTLHSGLPRQGPGSRADLDWALAQVTPPREARVLDAGCGPGADIDGLLAHMPEASVLAVDMHDGFVEEVQARFAGDARVTALAGDMLAVEGPFDVIWSAGALYSVGIETALQAMFAKLRPGGALVFSEMCWFGAPVAAVQDGTRAIYPEIGDEAALQDKIRAAGFVLKAQRKLPSAAWEAYFGPIAEKVARLRPGADAALTAVLDEAEAEAAYWRAHQDQFGYVLSVALRPE